ncbi:MAG TPA: hypothetical protein VFH39_04865, partial [Candidatus Saccharimonadales bacterium]|nr:hypothetical protein [Candidatus Saccharimonadales bacterium]
MPSLRLQRLPHLSTLLSFVLIFGLIGTAWLLHSHASTPAVAVQPESGSVASPATVVNDPTAGGGKAVRFEKAVIASHGTACGWTTKAPAYKHVIW